MDQKQLSQLDPKLKAAYEKVMQGTSPSSQVPSPTPLSNPASPVAPVPPPQPHETPMPPAAPAITPPSPSTPQTMQSTLSHGFIAGNEKSSFHIPTGVYILGVFLFIIAYTLFWINMWHVKLPFLP